MSYKKKHEVGKLAALIHDVYMENSCNVIADIGCGLGYLGEVLSRQYNLKVVGFELKESNCHNASKKAERNASGQRQSIHQLSFDISSKCKADLLQTIMNELDGSVDETENVRVCLVGLHCCGDLTPAMLTQFSQFDQCTAMVCMGCCYHRMTQQFDSPGYQHFPLSQKLRDFFISDHVFVEKLNGYALRMACQETASRWACKRLI